MGQADDQLGLGRGVKGAHQVVEDRGPGGAHRRLVEAAAERAVEVLAGAVAHEVVRIGLTVGPVEHALPSPARGLPGGCRPFGRHKKRPGTLRFRAFGLCLEQCLPALGADDFVDIAAAAPFTFVEIIESAYTRSNAVQRADQLTSLVIVDPDESFVSDHHSLLWMVCIRGS